MGFACERIVGRIVSKVEKWVARQRIVPVPPPCLNILVDNMLSRKLFSNGRLRINI